MIRTAAFLGVSGIFVSEKNSAPLSPAVSKVSSGTMEVFPIHACRQMPKLLNSARAQGWNVIGSEVNEKALEYTEASIDAPTILLMGEFYCFVLCY